MSYGYLQHLFGTIAGASWVRSSADFIPKDGKGDLIQLKGHDAVWMGLANPLIQKGAYDYCYPVSCVIDRMVEMDLNGEREILRLGGKGKDDYATSSWAKEMNALLDNPNPLQSWHEFRSEQNAYKKIFGYCPVWAVRPVGFQVPELMFNLPPWQCDIVRSRGNLISRESQVKSITWNFFGGYITVPAEEVFFLKDSYMPNDKMDMLLPQSRLVGLDMAISNCNAAMEADNVLLKKRGPLGFISHDAAAVKDSIAGYLPMRVREKKELQRDLTTYGLSLSQWQYVISRTAAKWNPMSYDVKQLGTKETVVASEKAICHRWAFPYVLYEMTGSTYANGGVAAKGVYQDVVIPNANKDYQVYNRHLKFAENNCILKACFDDLPVLQEDKKLSAESRNTANQAYEKEYKNGIIHKNRWRQLLGEETVEGGDTYYQEPANNQQSVANNQQTV